MFQGAVLPPPRAIRPGSVGGVDRDGLTGDLPHPDGGGEDLHPAPDQLHSRVGVLKAREDNEAAMPRNGTLRSSHLEADDVAGDFASSEADHGDCSDDAVLAEEAAEDQVPLPDIGQIPGTVFR